MDYDRDRLPGTGQDSPLDGTVEKALDRLSQRVSRRGVLGKLGKLALATLGVSIVSEVLPVSHGVAEADIACTDWRMCNFCGVQCDCCNGTSGIGTCPACATVGSFWTGCCCKPGALAYTVRYWDCMKGSCSNEKYNQCQNCTSCSRGCPQPVWGNGTYMCTAVIVTSNVCGLGCST